MALLTADEAKLLIPTLKGPTDDPKLDRLIDQAEQAIARYCLWPQTQAGLASLEVAVYRFTFDHSDTVYPREIQLPIRPIVSVDAVNDDPDQVYGPGTAVSLAEIGVDKAAGRIYLLPSSGHVFSSSRRAIRVTVSAGFTTAQEWLKGAIAEVVQANWTGRHNRGKQNTSQGGVNQSLVVGGIHLPLTVIAAIQGICVAENGFSGGSEVAVG